MELYYEAYRALLIIGSIYTFYLTTRFLAFIYVYIRPSSLSIYHHNHIHSSLPPWAIVTGSSDGIGLQYAHALAEQNFNVILHGRNSTKLHHVRHELQNEFPHLQFRILILDASLAGAEALTKMKAAVEELRELHITILINNVGTGEHTTGPVLQPYQENTVEDIDALININARFPAQFTRAVLPLLLSHGGPALVMTMGSMADFGMPFLSIYAACKAFDLSFSKALKREMKSIGRKNVEVLGIMTGGVTDVSWDKSKSDWFRPRSAQFARAALGKIGCGREVVTPWWSHAVTLWLLDSLPLGEFDWAMNKGVRMAMKKMESMKAEKKV